MEEYEIIDFPEIQYYMDKEGFAENTILITPNESMGIGIGSSTYLVKTEWLKAEEIKL